MRPRSLASPAQKVTWDVVVVGSGPAGTAAAITLARGGATVLIVEKRKHTQRSLGESIPPIAVELAEHFLGPVEHALGDGASQAAGNVSYWGNSAAQISDFYFTPKGYGLCVDRRYFDSALCEAAMNAGAIFARGTRFQSCKRDKTQGLWEIELKRADTDSSMYTANYILDCTGRRSTVASWLGIERQYHDQLFAFAQRFVTNHTQDKDTYTRVEASPQGWWYSNKLPVLRTMLDRKGQAIQQIERVVVFHTDKDSIEAKQAASTDGLMSLLQQSPHLAEYLEKNQYKPLGRVQGAAAGGERLSTFCGDGWLAVGDAAQSYDPLSSQGIYKALNSGSMAGQMVQYALSESNKDTFFMKRYAQEQSRLWDLYVQEGHYYYASEQRWPNHTFWSRRHATDIEPAKNTGKGSL